MIFVKQLENLQPFLISTEVYDVFFINSITSLPESVKYKSVQNVIFVIVDIFLKSLITCFVS